MARNEQEPLSQDEYTLAGHPLFPDNSHSLVSLAGEPRVEPMSPSAREDPTVSLRESIKRGERSPLWLLETGASFSLSALMQEEGITGGGWRTRRFYNRYQGLLPEVICFRKSYYPRSKRYDTFQYRVLPEEVEVVRVTLRRLAPQWSQAGSSPQDSLEPEGIIFGGTRSQIKVKEERTGDEAAKYRERLLELFAQHPGRSVTEEDIAAVVMEKLDLMAAVDLAGVVWTKLQPYLQGRRGEFKTRDKFLQLVEVIVDNLRADKRRASQSKPPEIPFDEEKPIRGFLPELEEVSLVEIMTAWGKLTPAQQQAMRLHLIQGFTIPVAAQLMERLEGAVKGLIHRGKTSLRWFILHPESLTRVDRERKPTTNGAPPKVLAAAMDKLKPGQREVLKLAEKLSNKALGERLEISTDAAAGRLKKARANLIWYLEHPGEERRRHTRKKPRPEPTYIEIIVRLIEQEKGKAIPIEDLQTKLGLSRDAVEVYIYRARRAGHHITTIRVPKLAYRLD